jgi:hypothetical protein
LSVEARQAPLDESAPDPASMTLRRLLFLWASFAMRSLQA